MCHLNSDHIKIGTDIFDWVFGLDNLDTNEQISVFNTAILNITNFIPNKT